MGRRGSLPEPVEPRLRAKLRQDASGCWVWTGSTTRRGWHGRISVNHHLVMAHRVAYELWVGPIPEGLKVLHRCDNPPCCNPMHLFLGTQRDNMQDAGRKGRMGVGKFAAHCKRGHPFEGNTYIHPVTGRRSCHKCISLRNAARRAHVTPDLHAEAAAKVAEALR